MNFMQILTMPKREEKSPEWYSRRRKGIGGSDSAAVLGVSKWRTPYQVWEDKTGRAVKEEPNAAMRAGTTLEESIRKMYSNETGRTVYDPGFAVDSEYPFIIGDVDGLCDDRIVEIKNCRREWDEIPTEYFFQVQHYMRLFNKPFADLAVLFSGQDFRIFTIERQPELWDSILPIYKNFWECVETDTPPELETLEDVNKAFRISKDSSIVLDATAIDNLQRIKTLKETIANLQTQLSDYEFEVKSQLGENAVGTDASGKTLVTWRTSKPRETFDTKQFKEDCPAIYNQYLRTGNASRTFLIK